MLAPGLTPLLGLHHVSSAPPLLVGLGLPRLQRRLPLVTLRPPRCLLALLLGLRAPLPRCTGRRITLGADAPNVCLTLVIERLRLLFDLPHPLVCRSALVLHPLLDLAQLSVVRLQHSQSLLLELLDPLLRGELCLPRQTFPLFSVPHCLERCSRSCRTCLVLERRHALMLGAMLLCQGVTISQLHFLVEGHRAAGDGQRPATSAAEGT
mmetsp:Transcript_8890/g.27351  ORF Transcript_8890/g.27351 Transcript_8890/m.27351 type:complete len:209 (+) Transcript_8890:609-1235(+)